MKNEEDYDAFATNDKAVVKDFVWKLSGRIPDGSASFENGWGYFAKAAWEPGIIVIPYLAQRMASNLLTHKLQHSSVTLYIAGVECQ